MSEAFESISNHIVILGWSSRTHRIIAEMRSNARQAAEELQPILIVADLQAQITDLHLDRVYVINGAINDPEVLKRARIDRAAAVLIPSSAKRDYLADGESVFALLTALAINPKIRACVEMADVHNGEVLAHIRENFTGGRIEIVSFEALADRLLAQAVLNEGITRVYNHLLTTIDTTNEVFVSDVAQCWVGKAFRELFGAAFEAQVILIGYQSGAELVINPKNRDHVFQTGDRVWFIAYHKADGLKVINPEASQL